MIKLPAHITGHQPTGAPDTLRTVRPRFLAPALSDARATAHAVGAHVIRLPRGMESRAAKLDNTPVLFARKGKTMHLLVDSVGGVMEIDGLSAEQIAGVHEWLDAAAMAPEKETDLERFLAKIGERTGGRAIEGKHLTASEADRLGKLLEADRLGLSDAIHPDVDNTARATASKASSSAEVDRLVALAATMDDSTTSGDAEVDRLARLGDSLGD